MPKRGRKPNAKIRFKAEAEIIAKHGTLSVRKIAELLKNEYGMVVSHTTVSADLKNDLDALSEPELKNKKSNILATIEELAGLAEDIAKKDIDSRVKLSAMDTYTKIVKTQADVLRKFEEAKLANQKHVRPIYNIFIGKPRLADLKKIRKGAKKNGEKEQEDGSTGEL